MRLRVVPITLREANVYIIEHHRHHGETRGCILVAAVADDEDVIRGVGIVGRPVARLLQDGYTAEVTRLCTDGALGSTGRDRRRAATTTARMD